LDAAARDLRETDEDAFATIVGGEDADSATLAEARLGPLLARGTISLDDATLTGPAVLDARARVLRCQRTRFEGVAMITARWVGRAGPRSRLVRRALGDHDGPARPRTR
jgi:hypothetical protein